MKRNRMNLRWDPAAEIIRHPASPDFGFRLFEELRTRLSLNYQGKLLTLEQLAFFLNIPLSTAHDWFRTAPLAQVQALLCLLEHLPTEDWQRILAGFLRDHHTLQHPRLAHDPGRVIELEKLLLERCGLTWIQGANTADRGFLATALGNAFHRVDPLHRNIAGLDLREPREFVPVAGVAYIKEALSLTRKRDLALQMWQEIAHSTAPLVLLNGILAVVPEVLPDIFAAAATRHVILTDDQLSLEGLARCCPPGLLRVVHLSETSKNPSLLQVAVRIG